MCADEFLLVVPRFPFNPVFAQRSEAVRRRYSPKGSSSFVLAAAGVAVLAGAMLPTRGERESLRIAAAAGLPDSVLRRPFVVLLRVQQEHLDEIFARPFERGRNWERVGDVTFLKDGAVAFESRVGVRVHGGGSRGRSPRSLRLYFRRSLDAEPVPGSAVGLDPAVRYQTLVLHNDFRADNAGVVWRYLNPLAYDVAERLGVPAAHTTPASVVVNREPPRPFVITESLNMDWLEARYGHRNFLMFETKDPSLNEVIWREGPLAQLQARFGEPLNWTLDNVNQVVDVDNLSRWFLALMFCGTRDELQGKMVLDLSRPESKWFWVAWDMDLSFGRKHEEKTDPWTFDHFQYWWDPSTTNENRDARMIILKQLFENSAEFRTDFAKLYITARDSLVTPQFIEAELSRYERFAVMYGATDTAYQSRVRNFLTNRPAAIGEILRNRFSLLIP